MPGFVVGLQSLGGCRFRVRYYDQDLGIIELVPFEAIVSPLERLQTPLVSIEDPPVTPDELREAAGIPANA